MNRRIVFFALGCAIVGCGTSQGSGSLNFGSASVSVPLQISDLTRVACVVSGTEMTNIDVDLGIVNGHATGIIAQIPAGTARTFVLSAYRNAAVVCSGSATTDIVANVEAQVTLVLQCTPDASNLGQAQIDGTFNFPPRIDTAVASTGTIAAGGQVTLDVTVSDPDGDPTTQLWSAAAGSFSSTTNVHTIWTAPNSTGDQTITITVNDNRGGTATLSLTVHVTAGSTYYALQFDGSTGCVVIGQMFAGGTTTVATVEAWFQTDGTADSGNHSQPIFSHRADFKDIGLWWNQPNGTLDWWYCNGSNCNTPILSVAATPGNSQWHHFAGTFTGTTTTSWLDGVMLGQKTNNTGVMNWAQQYGDTLGCNASDAQHFKGNIREIRVSSAVKYTAPFTPQWVLPVQGDTAYMWHFSDGSGTTVTESVAGNNGTISGGATWITTTAP